MSKKKRNIILIAILIAAIVIIAVIIGNSKKVKSNLSIETTDDMEILINQIYEGLSISPTVMTTVININDGSAFSNATGLTSTDKIDSVVVSEEPITSSEAYSLVLVKVKKDKYADDIAKEMNEKVDSSKWLDDIAERVYTTSSGNIVCLVMSSEGKAKPVYEKFKQLAGGIGKEYGRTNNEGMAGGDSVDVIPAVPDNETIEESPVTVPERGEPNSSDVVEENIQDEEVPMT